MNSAADVFDTVRDQRGTIEHHNKFLVQNLFQRSNNDTALVVRTDSDFRKQVIIQRYADYARRLRNGFPPIWTLSCSGRMTVELSPPCRRRRILL